MGTETIIIYDLSLKNVLYTYQILFKLMPMSFLTQLMFVSFVILLVVWISYWLRGDDAPKIPFSLWWFGQINCFIVILGVGLLQTNLGCTSLWGDCYAHNYPAWLAKYKPILLHSITIWCLLAISAAVYNFILAVKANR